MMLPPSEVGLPLAVRLGRAASALKASPLWNVTPSRRLKRQVSASICSQPVETVVGTIRRSSPDCQVRGSCRLARVMDAYSDPPMLRKELRFTGSSGTTRTMESWAVVTSSGSGVAVGAGVAVASGMGVAVGWPAAGAAGAAGSGSAAPPQATINRADNANSPASQVVRYLLGFIFPPLNWSPPAFCSGFGVPTPCPAPARRVKGRLSDSRVGACQNQHTSRCRAILPAPSIPPTDTCPVDALENPSLA